MSVLTRHLIVRCPSAVEWIGKVQDGQTRLHSNENEQPITLHSSRAKPCTIAWKIPWMEEPGGLQSMGSLGVGQD